MVNLIKTNILILIMMSSCIGINCDEYLNSYKNEVLNGRIVYFWINGRNMILKYEDLNNHKIKKYSRNTYELISQAENIKMGDTIIKNQSELFFLLKNKEKVIKIPIECFE